MPSRPSWGQNLKDEETYCLKCLPFRHLFLYSHTRSIHFKELIFGKKQTNKKPTKKKS